MSHEQPDFGLLLSNRLSDRDAWCHLGMRKIMKRGSGIGCTEGLLPTKQRAGVGLGNFSLVSLFSIGIFYRPWYGGFGY